jgi:ABC-type transporter Mla maintaining outer membrane lipid asymmetry ATPase subunit MlaF
VSFKLCNIWSSRKNNNTEHIIHRNLNWEINLGEYWILTGKSGAGKSLLANIMIGLEKPQSGSILWNDIECLNNLKNLWGMQFQNNALFRDLTIYENIIFPLRYDNNVDYNFSFLNDLCYWYLDILGLDNQLLNRYPNELSGGQQKLIALVRAIVKNPPMLLLDEPTAGLDIATSIKYDEVLKIIRKTTNKAIIVITHDFDRIKQADNIAYIEDGALSQRDPTDISLDWWSYNVH